VTKRWTKICTRCSCRKQVNSNHSFP